MFKLYQVISEETALKLYALKYRIIHAQQQSRQAKQFRKAA